MKLVPAYFIDSTGRKVVKVDRVQRRQKNAVWVSVSQTSKDLQEQYGNVEWDNMSWNVDKHGYRGYICKETMSVLLCPEDELDGPETNEFGPVCP